MEFNHVSRAAIDWMKSHDLSEGETLCYKDGQIEMVSFDNFNGVPNQIIDGLGYELQSYSDDPDRSRILDNLGVFARALDGHDNGHNAAGQLGIIALNSGLTSGLTDPFSLEFSRPRSASPVFEGVVKDSELGKVNLLEAQEVEQFYYEWLGAGVNASSWLVDRIGMLAGSGWKGAGKLITSYFQNSDHPWKQRIYELSLDQMCSAFDADALQVEISRLEVFKDKSDLQNLTFGCLREMSRTDADNFRKQYLTFKQVLRTALLSEGYAEELEKMRAGEELYDPCVDTLMNVCRVMFTEVQIFQFLENLITMMIQAGTDAGAVDPKDALPIVDEKDFEALTPKKFNSERLMVLKGCLKGTLNIDFDPHMQSNKPYVFADLDIGEEKLVRWCRFGSPTIEGIVSKAEINPEFRCFLQYLDCQEDKPQFLYMNLQNLEAKGIGDERGRAYAIIGLEEEEFPDIFTCVTLAQDSDFYQQEGKNWGDSSVDGPRKIDGDKFVEEFMAEMFDREPEHTGFYIPKKLNNADFRGRTKELMIAVRKAIEEGDEGLSRAQRLDFIEIFYAVFTLQVLKEVKPSFFNQACKDAIDRAGKNNTLLFRLIAILQGNENDLQHRRDTKVVAHSGALTVKKQPIIKSRRVRLISALHRMTKFPGVREGLRKNLAKFDLVGEEAPQIVRKDGQELEKVVEIVEIMPVQPDTVAELLQRWPTHDIKVLLIVQEGEKLGVDDSQFYISRGSAKGRIAPWISTLARSFTSGAGRKKVIEHGHVLNEILNERVDELESYLQEHEKLSGDDLEALHNLPQLLEALRIGAGEETPQDEGDPKIVGGWGNQLSTYLLADKNAKAEKREDTQKALKKVRDGLLKVVERLDAVVEKYQILP